MSVEQSVEQPGPATSPAVTLPRFPVTLWGYERRYVDSYVTGLAEQLERERQRSDQAERGLRQLRKDMENGRAQVPAWFSSVGTEIDQVLDNAGRAAAKLLAEAGRRIQAATDQAELQAAERLREAEEHVRKMEDSARAAVADAQAEGVRIEAAARRVAEEQLARADRDTRDMLARAHDETRRLEEQAEDERRQLENERTRLATMRQSMVEQLVQVYAPLGLTLVDARGEIQARVQDGQPTPDQAPAPGTGAPGTGAPVTGTAAGAASGQEPRPPDPWDLDDHAP